MLLVQSVKRVIELNGGWLVVDRQMFENLKAA